MNLIFDYFPLQNGPSVIWRETRTLSFADSILFSTMTNLWSTLEPQETALKSKESMSTFYFILKKKYFLS